MTNEERESLVESLRNAEKEPESIELDCPPGNPRPGDLIEGVLEGTGLTLEHFEEPSKTFGNWKWELKPDPEVEKLFIAAKPTFASRIAKLHNDGRIRYGSW